MRRRFEVRLGSAVGAGLSLAILLVTVAMGWTVYSDLYQVILDGFDRKLMAISTTTGSFIRGDDHRALERADSMRGLAWDGESRLLYQIDPVSRALLAIDRAGSAKTLAPVELDEVRALAWAPGREMLAALAADGGELALVALDRADGRVTRIGPVGFDDCSGLAYDASTDGFYCASAGAGDAGGGHLVRIDPADGRGEPAARLYGDYAWLAAGSAGGLVGFVYLDDGAGAELRQIEIAGGEVGRRQPLERRHWMNGVFGLAWDAGNDAGWLLSDRLLEIGIGKGEVVESAWAPPAGKLYERYSVGMRGTLERAGITYLYTQVGHGDLTRCVYILNADCTPEHLDHTELGAEDTLPPESILGQRDVLSRADIFLSPVRAWEKWGLLKNAFAPIFDDSGEVSAIAGADVNISIIREKTREALLQVFAIGVVFFLAGLLVSFVVASKIVGPIARVKEAALRFGAGRYDERISGSRLRELEQLSEAFNGLGERLSGTVEKMILANRELELLRRLREMEEHLGGLLGGVEGEPAAGVAWRLREEPEASSLSGVVGAPAGTLVWLAAGPAPRTEALKRRFEIATVLRAELERGDDEALWKRLVALYPRSIEAYLWIPRGRGELRWLARAAVSLRVVGADAPQTVRAEGGGRLRLEPGEALVVAGEGAAVDALLAGGIGPAADAGGELLDRLDSLAGGSRWGLTLVAARGE